jgi:hypothetical protein
VRPTLSTALFNSLPRTAAGAITDTHRGTFHIRNLCSVWARTPQIPPPTTRTYIDLSVTNTLPHHNFPPHHTPPHRCRSTRRLPRRPACAEGGVEQILGVVQQQRWQPPRDSCRRLVVACVKVKHRRRPRVPCLAITSETAKISMWPCKLKLAWRSPNPKHTSLVPAHNVQGTSCGASDLSWCRQNSVKLHSVRTHFV